MMDIVAYTYVYNEEDIIAESVEHMLAQGCDVYALDNGSTDNTRDIIMHLASRYPRHVWVEYFPTGNQFKLDALLHRIEAVHKMLNPTWGLLFGADELIESPWPGVSVANALECIGAKGYTAVPTVQAVFYPVDNGWRPGMSMKEYFRYWSFGRLHNVRAWRARSFRFIDGGHDVEFKGRRLWDGERLILRHYPFRNQEQAEHKVFHERLPRYAPEERRIGWHTHYDAFQQGYNFIRDPASLREYDPETFYSEVQRCPTC